MRVLMISTERSSPFLEQQIHHLRLLGVEVQLFYFNGAMNPINYLKAWFRIQNLLSKEHYDLVHAQFGQSAFPALPKRVPMVVSYRGSDVEGIVGPNGRYLLVGKILTTFSRLVALISDQATVVSESMIRKLPKRTYHVMPSGINLELFKPMDYLKAREQLGWSSDQKFIFFGGNPVMPVKRFSLATEAVEILREKMPGVEMIPAQGIPHGKMPVYMNASDVLLLTSLHEGSPNVVKEALACNLPIVSTNVGDVRHRISQIEGCYVCNDDSPQAIAAALHKSLLRNKRIAGRDSVMELDARSLAEKMITIYTLALKKEKI